MKSQGRFENFVTELASWLERMGAPKPPSELVESLAETAQALDAREAASNAAKDGK